MSEENQTTVPTCALCGEPMPKGEEMFTMHGYSGPCPKAPLPKPAEVVIDGPTAVAQPLREASSRVRDIARRVGAAASPDWIRNELVRLADHLEQRAAS